MRWYARPDVTAQQLGLAPRLASWNKADDPDQIRLRDYLEHAEDLLADSRVDGPWALRLDVGLPVGRDLLDGSDLDNYAYPLAHRIHDAHLVSVWCTKHLNPRSFVQIEAAVEVPPPADVLLARTTASATSVAFKEQIYAAVSGAAKIPPGPVRLELAFVVGPSRNWLNLWKQTIDSLDPILGRTHPDRPWHPRDGRIIELGMHVTVDGSVGNNVTVGIAAGPAHIESGHTRYVLRAAAREHGWKVLIDEDGRDIYTLPDSPTVIRVNWAASGAVLMANGTDGTENSFLWRYEDVPSKAERVLDALTRRTGLIPPAPHDDATPSRIGDAGPAAQLSERPFSSPRAEIERTLANYPRTRYAKVYLGMRRGLTNTQIAEEAAKAGEPINAESVANVRRLVQFCLDDVIVPAPSDAATQAGLYRELLNYQISPELLQHIRTKLAKLRELDPTILLTPLGHVHLGANDPSRPEKPETACPDCFLVHAGECP